MCDPKGSHYFMENPRTDCLKTCNTSGHLFSELCHKLTVWSNWIHLPLVQLRGATEVFEVLQNHLSRKKCSLPTWHCPWRTFLEPFWHGDKKGQGPKENPQSFQTQITTNVKKAFQRGTKLGGKQQTKLSHRDRWKFERILDKNFANQLKLTLSSRKTFRISSPNTGTAGNPTHGKLQPSGNLKQILQSRESYPHTIGDFA